MGIGEALQGASAAGFALQRLGDQAAYSGCTTLGVAALMLAVALAIMGVRMVPGFRFGGPFVGVGLGAFFTLAVALHLLRPARASSDDRGSAVGPGLTDAPAARRTWHVVGPARSID